MKLSDLIQLGRFQHPHSKKSRRIQPPYFGRRKLESPAPSLTRELSADLFSLPSKKELMVLVDYFLKLKKGNVEINMKNWKEQTGKFLCCLKRTN